MYHYNAIRKYKTIAMYKYKTSIQHIKTYVTSLRKYIPYVEIGRGLYILQVTIQVSHAFKLHVVRNHQMEEIILMTF